MKSETQTAAQAAGESTEQKIARVESVIRSAELFVNEYKRENAALRQQLAEAERVVMEYSEDFATLGLDPASAHSQLLVVRDERNKFLAVLRETERYLVEIASETVEGVMTLQEDGCALEIRLIRKIRALLPPEGK